MSFEHDRVEHEKKCYICDSPTQSHAAPNGWVCHTCKTEGDEETLKTALDIPPEPGLTLDTWLPCWWCDHTLQLGDKAEGAQPLIGIGYNLLEDYTGMIIASCPRCTKSSEYLTTATDAQRIADELGVSVLEYHPRHGWGEQ